MKRVERVTLTIPKLAHTVFQKLIQRLQKHIFTHLGVQAGRCELLEAKKNLPFANSKRSREFTGFSNHEERPEAMQAVARQSESDR